VTINTVGPTLMRFGTAEQKSFYLPKILSGELNFAIGYTEPKLAPTSPACGPGPSATGRVRHQREQDLHEWADMADYIWLAARTDPEAPKHKGISIISVPTSAAGFDWS